MTTTIFSTGILLFISWDTTMARDPLKSYYPPVIDKLTNFQFILLDMNQFTIIEYKELG